MSPVPQVLVAARGRVGRARRRLKGAAVPIALRLRYAARNRTSRAPIVDTSGTCDVTLTTYGHRIATVHLTVESIGAGADLPRSITLWLGHDDVSRPLPAPLRRLERRGLRIAATRDWGVHTKYFPHVLSAPLDAPLVTADDDVLYPRTWLSELLAAHTSTPGCVVAHRAYRVAMDGGRPAPYRTWPKCTSTAAAPDVFATGVSGVLYPVAMLEALRGAGDAFLRVAPRADDVWLHAVALRSGTRVRQVAPRTRLFPTVGGTQGIGLKHSNVDGGGNDAQIGATYGSVELRALMAVTSEESRRERPRDHL